MMLRFKLLTLLTAALLAVPLPADDEVDTSHGDALLAEYFHNVTHRITERTLADVETLEDWNARREEYRRQLQEMLGLHPWPEKAPLNDRVTGRTEDDAVIVENLTFESSPGLYVTGSFYRPQQQEGPLPAILYVCGHGRTVKDGISYGNKVNYQHHGAWFARNGYVCLIIDTVQLGEIEGIHHGTYRYGMWWWNNRGYTSAGVEAWNGIRAIDYLQSRAEVDPERIGVTGRSGGGAYSWWVAALDERIKAAVPVAGITSMHNHIVDGVIEGHCDCMYMVNAYAWDFPLVAALIAPRPLLISNTDKDRIFPLDGVVDVYNKTRRIYELHGKLDHIGLNICEGPHRDTPQLRMNAFEWMNRFLKEEDPPLDLDSGERFEPEQLKVFDELPEDERVTTAHEWLVPAADPALPDSTAELEALTEKTVEYLKEKCFRNWPNETEAGELDVQLVSTRQQDGVRVRTYEFTSEAPFRLPLIVVDGGEAASDAEVRVTLLDQARWEMLQNDLEESLRVNESDDLPTGQVGVFLAPRGIGPTEWNRDERKRVQIRRRFALLGTTVDSMRVYDTLRGLQAVREALELEQCQIVLDGAREGAGWALHAALLDPHVNAVSLSGLSSDYRDGPYFLNVSRELTLPGTLLAAASRLDRLTVLTPPDQLDDWQPVQAAARTFGWDEGRLQIHANR
jgi:cephalosporin-C deacetylase-like acetyl esterase